MSVTVGIPSGHIRPACRGLCQRRDAIQQALTPIYGCLSPGSHHILFLFPFLKLTMYSVRCSSALILTSSLAMLKTSSLTELLLTGMIVTQQLMVAEMKPTTITTLTTSNKSHADTP